MTFHSDAPASHEALAAFGKTTLRNLRLESENQELRNMIDAERLKVHHREIEIQALKDRIEHLIEKAETRVLPVIVLPEPPILETEEFDLLDDIKGGNAPLIL